MKGGTVLRRQAAMMGMASVAMAAVAARGIANKIYGHDNIRRYLQQQKRTYDRTGSIAEGNRWGGPHLHAREIARRKRQQRG